MQGRLRLEGDIEWIDVVVEVLAGGSIEITTNDGRLIGSWQRSDIEISRIYSRFEISAEGEVLELEVEDPLAFAEASGAIAQTASLRDRVHSANPNPSIIVSTKTDNASATRERGTVSEISTEVALQRLTDEWVYRHSHQWSLIFRFGLSSVFVLAIPWIAPGVRAELGRITVVFPVASVLVTVVSTWVINEEFRRTRATYNRIEDLREACDPSYTRTRRPDPSRRITALVLFFYVAVLLTVAVTAAVALLVNG